MRRDGWSGDACARPEHGGGSLGELCAGTRVAAREHEAAEGVTVRECDAKRRPTPTAHAHVERMTQWHM